MIALTAALLLTAPQGADWPQYRGPERTGAIADRNWSSEGHAKPLWTKDVGKGYSCPSIVGDRLVTMGFDEKASADRIVCLNRTTGEELWRYEFATGDAPQYHGGGTLTTPTIRDGRVYCINRQGKTHVLELATGKLAWSRDYQAELKLEKTFHGYSASPLLAGNRIYLHFGGLVAAVAANDGELIWRSKDRGDLSYSNIALLNSNGTPALAAITGPTFIVLRREDGQLLHELPWKLRGNAVHCAVPLAIGSDRVFVSTAYGKGCAMLRLGKDKVPEKIWANRTMRNKVTACVQHDGHLYGFDESMLRCIDFDGKAKWRVRGLGLGSLSLAGDRLLILSSDGELIVAEATPEEFRELSRRKVLEGGEYWTVPVLADGLIYVRNSLGKMVCLDHRMDPDASPDAAQIEANGKPAPAPKDLFERHAQQIGGDALQNDTLALQLGGTWSIALRGMAATKMQWTFAPPNRWDLRVDDDFFYTFDGKMAWTVEPQGPRILVDDEHFEHRHLCAMPDMLAPICPNDAKTDPTPVRFAENACWKVRSKLDGHNRSHYFRVDSGQLVGSDGQGLSTILLHGSQRLNGMTLQRSITRFRAEDGQEHVMQITSAAWIDVPAKLFEMPVAVTRLLRTPAQLAADEAKLRKRFAGAFARYQAKDKGTPIRDDIFTLRVRDGDLWLGTQEAPFRIAVERESEGTMPLDGPPIRTAIVRGDDGKATAIKIIMPGGNELLMYRLPK